MMPLPPTKFHEILFSSFRGVALTNCVTDRRTGQKQYVSHQSGGRHNQTYNSKSPLQMGSNNMPLVDNAVHLGIIRTTSLKENTITNVEENIYKARRSAYGLFDSGFHGYNGLDVDTMLHLYKICILPVLLYELGLILPQGPQLEQLEIAQRSYSSKY